MVVTGEGEAKRSGDLEGEKRGDITDRSPLGGDHRADSSRSPALSMLQDTGTQRESLVVVGTYMTGPKAWTDKAYVSDGSE